MHKDKFVFSQLIVFLDRNKFNYIDNITSNVPPISLTNVPGVSLLNVPPVSLTNVPEK